jgi:hypothetical protein
MLSGKRQLNTCQMKALSERFNVSANAFFKKQCQALSMLILLTFIGQLSYIYSAVKDDFTQYIFVH